MVAAATAAAGNGAASLVTDAAAATAPPPPPLLEEAIIDVAGIRTHVTSARATTTDQPHLQIIVIPGNPGACLCAALVCQRVANASSKQRSIHHLASLNSRMSPDLVHVDIHPVVCD
jgi:hypothetical protein